MRKAWILFVSDTRIRWVDSVYLDKTTAEAALRAMRDDDIKNSYVYTIQETNLVE